jgi:serine/threonine protein phosphatase PrpC
MGVPHTTEAATLRTIRAAVGGAWIQAAALSDLGLGPIESRDRAADASDDEGHQLLAVANGGEEPNASRECLKALLDAFSWSEDPAESRLRRGFVLANEKLRDRSDFGHCSLIAIAIMRDLKAWIALAGDCRAYRLRAGELERLASPDPESEPPRHLLGSDAHVEMLLYSVDVRPGDCFLLCSAELSGLSNDEIAQALRLPTPRVMTSQLIKRLRALGQPVNITVQIAAVSEPRGRRVEDEVAVAPAWKHMLVAASIVGISLVLGAGGVLTTRQLLIAAPESGEALERVPLPEQSAAPDRAEAAASPVAATPPAEQEASPPLGPMIGYVDPASEEESIEIVAHRRFARESRPPTARSKPATAPKEPATAPIEPAPAPAEPAPAPAEPVAAPAEPNPAPAQPVTAPAEPATPALEAANAPVEPATAPVERVEPVERPPEPAEPTAAEPERAPEPAESGASPVGAQDAMLVASAPPVAVRDDGLERAIQDFLGSWSQAVEQADHERYRRLGFEESRGRFNRKYKGHKSQRLRLEPLEMRRGSDSEILLRVLSVYTYRDRRGSHLSEKERHIVLRESSKGLQYAGTW